MHQEEERAVFTSRDLYRDGVGWQEAVPLSLATFEVAPLIVLPGYGKAFDIRHLADLWSLPTGPASHFNVRGDVFVVGLGLARDDFIIQALFRDTLQYVENERRITIINPDPRALDNYAFLVGRPNVAFLCKRFDESDIKLMAYSAETDRWRHELEAGSPPPRPGAST